MLEFLASRGDQPIRDQVGVFERIEADRTRHLPLGASSEAVRYTGNQSFDVIEQLQGCAAQTGQPTRVLPELTTLVKSGNYILGVTRPHGLLLSRIPRRSAEAC